MITGRGAAESIAVSINAQKLFVADSSTLSIHVISFDFTNSFSAVNLTYQTMIDISEIFEDEKYLTIQYMI